MFKLFAEKNVLVGIDGMDHHVQQFAHFRLKTHIFHDGISLSSQ